VSQLRALVGLRWRMVRSPRARAGLLGLLGLLALLLIGGAVVGQALRQSEQLFDIALLAPTLFLVFAALTVVAPLVAGGGNELFPDGQLVAYPIEPRTVFAGSVVMAPLNLAWLLQVVLLVTMTAVLAERGPRVLLALLTTLAFIAMTTVVGQAAAWGVVGVRQRPAGRTATRVAGFVLLLLGLGILASGSTTTLLDHTPTKQVVIATIGGSTGRYGNWCATTLVLLALTWCGARLGVRTCDWALRRTAPTGTPELTPVRRRTARGSILSELLAVDQSSVWRSTPLRRGCLVLAVLPGAVAMLAHPTWISLTLLPGLVAAGAGLLFGVNAFCLDGGGAVWVSTLPHPPRYTFLAKLLVVGQTCGLAVLMAMALAASQVRTLPSTAEVIAVVGSVLGSTLLVVAACGRLSVERPHKADLRGPRDTPAPPATMAVYSLRLALGTTWAGLAFGAAAASGSMTASLAASVAVLSVGARSLVGTFDRWRSPILRSQVVTTVGSG
jgi:hypothetical protein